MNMRERLAELVKQLDPDVKDLVTEVVLLERQNMDAQRPRVRDEIRDLVDKYAKIALRKEGRL